VSGVVDTADVREQAERRAEALRLVRLPDLRLTLLPDLRIRIVGEASPEVVAAVRRHRAELAELLGVRCLICGAGLAGQASVRVEGGGYAHARCRGRRG